MNPLHALHFQKPCRGFFFNGEVGALNAKFPVVNLNRICLVNLLRIQVVNLERRRVVNITGFSQSLMDMEIEKMHKHFEMLI